MKIYTLRTISPRVKDFSPSEFISSFGITYLRYYLTSMAEIIIYEGCANIPGHPYQMPYYIEVIETMEAQDKEVKSVEIIARDQGKAVLVTYNKSKEFVDIEHGDYDNLMLKFNEIHKQIMAPKQN